MFSILFCCFALFRISSMETWSCSLMFNTALRQLFSNTLNFWYQVASGTTFQNHIYQLVVSTHCRDVALTLPRCLCVTIHFFFNLPNVGLANAILLLTSSDEFGTSDPKNLNSFTISISFDVTFGNKFKFDSHIANICFKANQN